ncbi:CocE/NonD family hydrolase [Streptomyces sp. MBT65]|uniref:CocE/NonD family hydrolase n=1 Tax=Streptomyces sp. MBT65 TaxID=1488395 RepID=UPI00190DCAC6|nr:CocE/NonD family hydrolase [Streptomyces sp. MBT65]MBK3574955.1 CocE/NonD family hydrolase [Streptomyces sp. MBT65]
MNLSSRLTQRLQHLPPPTTRDLVVEHDLPVPVRDGATLLADRWSPASGGDGLPTALVRSAYGRAGANAAQLARPLAERGFQVVIVSSRGTFGSGGSFDAFRCEREDGLDTLDWVVKQAWCGESMILVGGSYLGYTVWSVADQLPPQVKAIIPAVSESGLTLDWLPPSGFSLEIPFLWGTQVAEQERPRAVLRNMLGERKKLRAMRTLPLSEADTAVLGEHVDYVQNVLTHDADDPFWAPLDHRERVADITVPASLIGGWYDFFLPGQLRDFRTLQEAGRPARLTVGPWPHFSLPLGGQMVREALTFGLAHAQNENPPERAAVRLYVMGENTWRDFDSWPPEEYAPQRFHLHADGLLSTDPSGESTPDSYRYDPSDPTPAVGGARMTVTQRAGRVDNKALEARPDVLTYTTAVLDQDVEVIGEVAAEIWFRSSLPSADVFVRLCDVDERGRSFNICDGLTALVDADRAHSATVGMWPTAHRFKRGHRIRVQVSSGAFPRYNRNPGTGEPRATAHTLRSADQQVFHDPQHPSAILLPVRQVD